MVSIFDQGPPPPCPAPFNMAAHVLARGRATPDKPALQVLSETGAQTWSHGEISAAVQGTGTGLLQAGLAPGDIVVLRLGNTIDFPIAYLGAIAAGIVPVPTSSQLTEPEVADILADLSPAAVLRDPNVTGAPGHREIGLPELQAMRALPPCDFDMGPPDRLGYIVYTSGTSGRPRPVAHAHRAIWARQMMFDGWYGLRVDDRLLHAGAFNWTYTLGTGLMDPWTIGATALIPEPGTDPARLPALLAAHGATLLAAAPGVFRKMLKSGEKLYLPQLRHGLAAGEKLSPALKSAWEEATGTGIFEAFGMSECSTFISGAPTRPAEDGALGFPQVGRRVAILGEDGPVPYGEPGTIAVHRDDPGLMLAYLNAPDETAARFRGDWFLTGDRGSMAPSGQVSYEGRDDDMMNAGGYRVSPIEVETALTGVPGVEQIGVTDVEIKPDTFIIVAFYTGPEPVADAVLAARAQDRLARYKQPRAYVHLPEMPTNPNGKLSRRDLKPLFESRPQ
ncbi:class I adenylate-forming enzyme family protein [Arenibacterium halophilum]|uniref:Acyl--CoA ligase n=1 Tax=Arenibacterium halophilum TaxID=2583821 RepID=A0ABY2X9M5_9RHOB|nr:class I adenylate-forming enzyme family protein [Arenibacterium halophilum]TMV13041.1 acyl--CoA ligase [Arenibacterium halophilum]